MSRYFRHFSLVALFLVHAVSHAQPRVDSHGDALPAGAVARLGTIQWRADGNIELAAFRDEKTAVTVSESMQVQIWDLATGKELRRFDVGGTDAEAAGFPGRMRGKLSSFSSALSRDGKRLVCDGRGLVTRLWDVDTGKQIKTFGRHSLFDISLSADGTVLVARSHEDGSLIWNPATADKPVHFGEKAKPGVFVDTLGTATYVSADGKSLVQVIAERVPGPQSQQPPAQIVIRDTTTGKETRRLAKVPAIEGKFIYARGALFSADLQTFAFPVDRGFIFFARLADGTATGQVEMNNDSRWRKFLLAPDGKTLIAAAAAEGPVGIYEVPTGKLLRRSEQRPGATETAGRPRFRSSLVLALSLGEKRLLVCDGTSISLFDLSDCKRLSQAAGHTDTITDAFFATGGAEIITLDEDGAARRWDAKSGKEVDLLKPPAGAAFCLTPDARTFVAAGIDGTLKAYDAATLKERFTIGTPRRGRRNLPSISANSKYLAVGDNLTQPVEVFDVATGEKRATLQAQGDAPVGDRDLRRLAASLRGRQLAFSPDGTLLAIATGRQVSLWDVEHERVLGQIPMGEDSLQNLAIAPDGRTIALETSAETSLWELATFTKRLSLHKHPSPVPAELEEAASSFDDESKPPRLAFSPDGALIARVGSDRRVRLFDTWTGLELGGFEGHRGDVHALAFAPDGQKLVTAGADTTALIWDLSPTLKQRKVFSAPLEQSKAEAAWGGILEQDAARAHKAMRTFAADPAKAVAFVKQLVEPATAPDAKLLAKLIGDLGSATFAVREKAGRELERLGDGAAPALRKAAKDDGSAEVRKAAVSLLKTITRPSLTRDQIRAVRVVELLERMAAPEARALLKELAGGAAEVIPTPQAAAALSRLAAK